MNMHDTLIPKNYCSCNAPEETVAILSPQWSNEGQCSATRLLGTHGRKSLLSTWHACFFFSPYNPFYDHFL